MFQKLLLNQPKIDDNRLKDSRCSSEPRVHRVLHSATYCSSNFNAKATFLKAAWDVLVSWEVDLKTQQILEVLPEMYLKATAMALYRNRDTRKMIFHCCRPGAQATATSHHHHHHHHPYYKWAVHRVPAHIRCTNGLPKRTSAKNYGGAWNLWTEKLWNAIPVYGPTKTFELFQLFGRLSWLQLTMSNPTLKAPKFVQLKGGSLDDALSSWEAEVETNHEISVGLSPLPVTVANEGLGWDPLLKM